MDSDLSDFSLLNFGTSCQTTSGFKHHSTNSNILLIHGMAVRVTAMCMQELGYFICTLYLFKHA
jgi:hypothetical protein